MDISKDELKNILKDCLIDGIKLVEVERIREKEKGWSWAVKYHEEYPTISNFNNGLPSFNLSDYKKVNYSEYLTKEKKYDSLESWKRYYNLITESEFFKKYLGLMEFSQFEKDSSLIEIYNEIHTYNFLARFVDSYLHKYSFEFEEENFNKEFENYYKSIFTKRLEFEIVVPIIFAKFDFEELKIDSACSIKKMDDSIQLARNKRKSYSSSAHDNVIGSATHAFFLKNWWIDNDTQELRNRSLADINGFEKPKFIIENLFATLRILLNIETGFCQILSVPKDWHYQAKANLPQIFVTSEKNYPDKFEDYGWLDNSKTIKSSDLEGFENIYEKLDSNQFRLAVKRLNSAYLRKNEEDSIIDITIVLESLLTNDSNSEITFRLATRASQICKLEQFKSYTPKQVFSLCKKIYRYRSAIVHGDFKKMKKSRVIKIEESDEVEIIEISLDLLKHIIKVLIKKDIKNVEEIDEIML